MRTVILTGDTERVTRHVAEQLCFEITGLVTGKQFEVVSAEELKSLVEKTNVFASITPEQKLMIIRALKECGHTVAYIGDGVNDAPSLRAADVGISFDNAVDVAKEAASVILLKTVSRFWPTVFVKDAARLTIRKLLSTPQSVLILEICFRLPRPPCFYLLFQCYLRKYCFLIF